MDRGRSLAAVVVVLAVSLAVALTVPAVAGQDGEGVREGDEAPSFSVETLENARITLDDCRGKVIVLEFFASGCSVCEKAMPALRPVRERFDTENLTVLSVESDPSISLGEVRDFRSEHGGDWLFAKAPDVADRYGVERYPTLFVIGPDGRIVFRKEGMSPPGLIMSRVDRALRQGHSEEEDRPEDEEGSENAGDQPESEEQGPDRPSTEGLGVFSLSFFALGIVVGGCLGILGGYFAWGRGKSK